MTGDEETFARGCHPLEVSLMKLRASVKSRDGRVGFVAEWYLQ